MKHDLETIRKYRKGLFGLMVIICGLLFFYETWILVGVMIILSIAVFHLRQKEMHLQELQK